MSDFNMTDVVSSLATISDEIVHDFPDDFVSKLGLVVRKAQEGKTSICIQTITKDKTKNIHIVLTMNTLASGMQFFGRMEEKIGSENIIVFNSKRKTAGNCKHAKSVDEIMQIIREFPIKVIVCCANEKRIRDSIPKIFRSIADSIQLKNRKFVIHIDEAHKYIPENRQSIIYYNENNNVESIIGYTASPDGVWSNRDGALFENILIRDVERDLQIVRSPQYFGVNCCDFIVEDVTIIDSLEREIDEMKTTYIDERVIERSYKNSKTQRWFGSKYPFNFGNELLLLNYFENIALPKLREIVSDNEFSYHFVPAYMRKVTHYHITDILLNRFPTSNVIVINGNGTVLFRNGSQGTSQRINSLDELKSIITDDDEKKKLLEPSYVVQKLIEPFPNCPTFITGYSCVNMSVTLINETIGNFDSIVMAHQHLKSDDLYQLCRFLFTYLHWSAENKAKIKKTKFYSLTREVVDICLDYEKHIERLADSDFAGRIVCLSEIVGEMPNEEPSYREQKKLALASVTLANEKKWRRFKVYDGNDEETWRIANEFYRGVTGKDLNGKTKPSKMEDGFYYCSTTKKVAKQSDIDVKKMEKQSWHSTFQLLPGCLNYARVFVGYDDIENPDEYTIHIKYVNVMNTPENIATLLKYGKGRNDKSDGSKSDSTTSSAETSEDY
jgi:hypothetical protein